MKEHLQFYIDGQWTDPVTPRTLDVINPSTEEVASRISLGSAADVDKAVQAARRAFESFSRTSRDERVALLKDIEATPFLKKVQGDLVTGLYNNKKLWPLFGYEGSSWEKGGYVNRGFDDIDWL